MNALRVLFCCVALATIAGCVLDEPVEDSGWVVGEEDEAVRLEQIPSDHEDVLTSASLDEDGTFTSDPGPDDIADEEEGASARKLPEDGEDPDLL